MGQAGGGGAVIMCVISEEGGRAMGPIALLPAGAGGPALILLGITLPLICRLLCQRESGPVAGNL